MSPRAARNIRLALDLPRLPKDMSKVERLHYRQTKARYNALPAPAKATFLDDVHWLKAQFARLAEIQAAEQAAKAAAAAQNGAPYVVSGA